MRTTIQINGKDVEITLTQQQVSLITKASQKVEDRVTSFDAACREIGTTEKEFAKKYSILDKQGYATEQLKVIAKSLNEEWVANWKNSNEYKYYIWYNMRGGSLHYVFNCDSNNYSSTPAPLVFKTRALAEYAYNTFEGIWKDYFLG